ncbi:MAG: PD-(D/E)XK nuclease domain-containing protein [Clostridiales bacterium]|nr:PD-(D/E)XK nuclease domain-containing protein [Clostridiales bacterium]
MQDGACSSYWTKTGKMDDIVDCIQTNVDRIRDDIIRMLEGEKIRIKLSGFATERIELNTREQIISAMVILGFLSYYNNYISIPNNELKMKFADSLANKKFGKVAEIVKQSNEMLNATLDKDTDTMEQILREAHSLYTPVLKYNDENSLSCVITLVYLTALDDYRIMREQKSGEGFADFIFYPKKKNDIAFIIELKVNDTPDNAIAQIKKRNYIQTLKDYTGEKLLIGITYDSKDKKHEVKIEEL